MGGIVFALVNGHFRPQTQVLMLWPRHFYPFLAIFFFELAKWT